jgi:nucleoid-associated protein YgaU
VGRNWHLEALLLKYRPVLKLIDRLHVDLRALGLEDGKLLIRADAPSEAAKACVWDEIKEIDPSFSDIAAEITAGPDTAAEAASDVYTVQPGDTLSSIAESYYGDPQQYGRILRANRSYLEDPDTIRPGQRLIIPIE